MRAIYVARPVNPPEPVRAHLSTPAPVPPVTRICSYLIIGLMVVESAVGLLVHDIYPEARWAVAALRGNDLVTLVLVVPVFTVAVVRGRGSTRWLLVWLAGLFYGVYNFAYYAFGTAFNDIFLLHVATLAGSVLALVALITSLDVDAIAARVRRGRGDRVVAGYMALVGGGLAAAWTGLSVRFAITGELPRSVMPPNTVHLVYALDMSLLAPTFIAGAVLLWIRRPWGYVLGVSVNLFGAAYLLVLEFVGGFEADAQIRGTTWLSPPALGGALLCASAAAVLVRRISDMEPNLR
jgi:hypothetical protein